MKPDIKNSDIRLYTLSWNSFEIYALLFLLFVCLRILILQKNNKNIDRRLIQMYILSVVFTDSTYRMASMQISELIIILAVMFDICRHKFRIIINSLTVFMLTLSGIFLFSDIAAILQGMYSGNPYPRDAVLAYTAGNNIKFLLIIYMVSKIIREYREKDDIFSLIDFIRLGGVICACVSLFQVVMFMAGYVVSGVFYRWGIPRTKGLSHEPATNAFVLLMPLILSVFHVEQRKYKLHVKSLLLLTTAFFFCFSTGAFPVFIVAMMIYYFKSVRMIEQRRRFVANAIIAVGILTVGMIIYSTDFSAFASMFNKLLSLFSDYENATNSSGRGGDARIVELVTQHNFLLGVGAFNAVTIFGSISSITNMYFTFFSELGFLGMTLFVLVSLHFAWNCRIRLKTIRNSSYYANIFSYSAVIPIMLAWLRVFFFHQIWIVLALLYLKGLPPCRN